MKIITDRNAYRTVQRVRGIPDAHKPNSHRPFFYKRTVRIPVAYLLKAQNTVVAAPEIVAEFEKTAQIYNGMMQFLASQSGVPSSFLTPLPYTPPSIDENAFTFRHYYGVGMWPTKPHITGS